MEALSAALAPLLPIVVAARLGALDLMFCGQFHDNTDIYSLKSWQARVLKNETGLGFLAHDQYVYCSSTEGNKSKLERLVALFLRTCISQ